MRWISCTLAASFMIMIAPSNALATGGHAPEAAAAPSIDQYIWLARNLVQDPGFTFDPKTDSMVNKGPSTPNPEDPEYKWLLTHSQQYRTDNTAQKAETMSGTAADHVLDKEASVPYVPKSAA